jgi:hypothetical protein
MMTTTKIKSIICTVCGKTSMHSYVASTNTLGPPDLDTRPSEMMRSTIKSWIQTCPSCGYCAPLISKRNKRASEFVNSNYYQEQLFNPDFSELANAFLCCSLIQENAGKYSDAGMSSIYAAWACDDDGSTAGANTCRERAIDLLQKARENNQKFAEQSGGEDTLLVDLLRRSGQFDKALNTCNEGLIKEPIELIADILRLERTLIKQKDNTCHSVSEVISQSNEKRPLVIKRFKKHYIQNSLHF